MEVAEAEERDCWDQCGTIPVTAMKDVPPGDQDTGREEVMKVTERGSMGIWVQGTRVREQSGMKLTSIRCIFIFT